MERGRTQKFCQVCRKTFDDFNHNDSPIHRFHFKLWSFERYKKALAKDRNGIVMKIEPVTRKNGLQFNFNNRRGKYTAHVQIDQFVSHNKTIKFNCKITNNSKLPYCITERNLFYPSTEYSLDDNLGFFKPPDHFIPELQPGEEYNFCIQYKLDERVHRSDKIHIACKIQNDDKPEEFTIIKSIIVKISEQTHEDTNEEPSPYISEKWTDIHTVHEPTNQFNYPEHYCVPKEYLKVLKRDLNYNNLSSTELSALQQIQRMLGSYERVQLTNYQDFWHILLWSEELVEKRMLEKFNMTGVTVTLRDSKYIILQVPGLEEKRPSVIPGDIIELRLQGDHTVYKGKVKFIREKTIEIHCVYDELLKQLGRKPDTKLDVQFELSRLSYERMHEGIDKVAANKQIPLLFDPIIPKPYRQIYNLTNNDFYNQLIVRNPEQKKAVVKILNSQQMQPYIVYGPPGTGKTITIVEAILQIKKRTNKKILVCAPANSACDNITEKLIPYCRKTELIRVHSNTRERSSLTPQMLDYSNIEDDVVLNKVNFNKYRIVITTLTLIGRSRDYNPDCVFVDEAAQASEPEVAIAIGLLKCGKQIVLAGDPKQLGPICLSNTAKQYGYDISLLERLMTLTQYRTFNDDFVTMLRLNYRSHRDILEIPNELFYDNKLIPKSEMNDPITRIVIFPRTGPKKQCMNKEIRNVAVEFCGTMSKERKEGASPSFFNPYEVEMVIDYVKAMLSSNFPTKVLESDIGIVTPYKRQVYKIKNRLIKLNWKNIEVGTTESFQGREKRIIIISTVRAQHCHLRHDRKYNLGFVRNEKRFNVAMTRAKSKLILIGCSQVLGYDEKWLKFMDLCKNRMTHFGAHYKPRTVELMNDIFTRMDHFDI